MAKREHLVFETRHLPAEVDELGPDTSEIRLLLRNEHASMVHGSLPPGGVTLAIRHKTVHEIWYILGGEGELWRRTEQQEEVVHLRAGVAVTIPLGVAFQCRNVWRARPSAPRKDSPRPTFSYLPGGLWGVPLS